MLKYTKDRWSSLLRTTERIKTLWFSLEVYFEKYKDPDISPKFNAETQIYISLLCCLLRKINAHIQYFEKDTHNYSTIMPKLKETFIMCCRFAIKEKSFGADPSFDIQFKTLKGLPFYNRVKLKPHLKTDKEFKEYFMEKYEEFRNFSQIMPKKVMEKLFTTAKNFMTELVCQMRERIPFDDDFLESCEALKMKTIDKSSWQKLASKLKPIIDSQGIQDELEIAEYNFEDLQHSFRAIGENQIKFWKNKSTEYPIMSKIALAVFTLPYSSVSIERTFSMLKDIRDPRRNRLSCEGTEACLLGHQQLGSISNLSVNHKEIDLTMRNIWKSKDQSNLQPQNTQSQMEILSSKPQDETISNDEEVESMNEEYKDEDMDNQLFEDVLKKRTEAAIITIGKRLQPETLENNCEIIFTKAPKIDSD